MGPSVDLFVDLENFFSEKILVVNARTTVQIEGPLIFYYFWPIFPKRILKTVINKLSAAIFD